MVALALIGVNCNEDDDLPDPVCTSEQSAPGELEVYATQVLPDGTHLEVEVDAGGYGDAYRYYSTEYFIVWQDDLLEYMLTFSTGSPDVEAKAFDLEDAGAEICATWRPGTEDERPACATAEGDAACQTGCVPVIGSGFIDMESHCDRDGYPQTCDESVEGLLMVRADTVGQLVGFVRFKATRQVEKRQCATGGSFGGFGRGCTPGRT